MSKSSTQRKGGKVRAALALGDEADLPSYEAPFHRPRLHSFIYHKRLMMRTLRDHLGRFCIYRKRLTLRARCEFSFGTRSDRFQIADLTKRRSGERRSLLLPKTRRVICAMPELAEVEWYRKQWDAGLGNVIVYLRLHARKRVFRGTNTRALRENLVGQKLLRSTARGKRMLFEFSSDNPETIGARENIRSWLGIHLGMTGKTHVAPANFRPGKHDHLVLYQRERALVFTDSRQFGRVRFHHGRDQPDWWKSKVPEIVSPQFDRKFLDQFLDRHRKAPIKAVLLMQNGFSGVGNWMADEILWRAKVLPSKRIRKITARERAELFRATKFVVRRSLETLGKDFSDPPRSWLIHQKWKRDGVCPKHRTPLRHATVAGRTTAWCAKCQR